MNVCDGEDKSLQWQIESEKSQSPSWCEWGKFVLEEGFIRCICFKTLDPCCITFSAAEDELQIKLFLRVVHQTNEDSVSCFQVKVEDPWRVCVSIPPLLAPPFEQNFHWTTTWKENGEFTSRPSMFTWTPTKDRFHSIVSPSDSSTLWRWLFLWGRHRVGCSDWS